MVQQRPHKIRTSKDKNNDMLFSTPFGDMDACWQEMVTTALGVGVFLECSELVCSVMIKLDEKSSLKNIHVIGEGSVRH